MPKFSGNITWKWMADEIERPHQEECTYEYKEGGMQF